MNTEQSEHLLGIVGHHGGNAIASELCCEGALFVASEPPEREARAGAMAMG